MNESPSGHGAAGAGSGMQGAGGRGRDVLGLALVVVAVFGAAWVVMALRDPQPGEGGATGAAMAAVDLLGPVALLLAAAALAALGMGLWFRAIRGGIGRHLLGLAVTSLTASLLFGAWSRELGGSFGDAIGGSVSRRLTPFVGIPFWLVVLAFGGWLVWRRRAGAGSPGPAGSAADTANSIKRAPPQSRSSESDGVTRAEAEALLPRVPAPPPRPGVVETLSPRPASKPSSPAPTAAPSGTVAWAAQAFPYPPDVRRQGGIPEGARPLTTSNPSAPSPSHVRTHESARDAAAVQREPEHQPAWLAQDAAAGRVGGAVADHASADRAGDALDRPRSPAPAGAGPRTEPQDLVASPPADIAAVDAPLEGEEHDGPDFEIHVAPPTPPSEPTSAAPALPAPSWEQPALFDGEPVDAYGTPMSLVDALRKSEEDLRAEVGESEADEWVGGATPLAESAATPPVEASANGARIDLTETEDGDEIEDDDEEAPLVRAHTVEDEDADAVEDEEDLDDDGVDEAGLDEGFDEGDLAGEPDGVLAKDEDELEIVAETVDAPAPKPSPAPESTKKPAVAAPSLFEEPALTSASVAAAAAPPAPAPEPRSEPKGKRESRRSASRDEPKAAPELAEVVLQPQSPPPPASQPQPVGSTVQLSVDPKVFKAGCLFVERQRVAVSMLQREFGFDFQEATEVLDQLQRAGLIGPYLGGQRRDILLTLEQWKEKVGAV
jgi:hypothetical protein